MSCMHTRKLCKMRWTQSHTTQTNTHTPFSVVPLTSASGHHMRREPRAFDLLRSSFHATELAKKTLVAFLLVWLTARGCRPWRLDLRPSAVWLHLSDRVFWYISFANRRCSVYQRYERYQARKPIKDNVMWVIQHTLLHNPPLFTKRLLLTAKMEPNKKSISERGALSSPGLLREIQCKPLWRTNKAHQRTFPWQNNQP